MEKFFDKYREFLKYELNYSKNTIKGYFFHLQKYQEYLIKNGLDYRYITKDDAISLLKYLDNNKLSSRSISNFLSSLRGFYDFLVDEHVLEKNVFRLVSNPKIGQYLPNFLSYEELRKVLDSITCETVLDLRNKLIVEILYATGIRLSELINIKIKDIDKNAKSIRILGKGNKERFVYFGSYAQKALDDYLAIKKESEYLFLNKDGNKLSSRGIEKIIDKVCAKACINNKVSPHTFRHTFATHLLNNGADIKSVQQLLGHSSLNTTEVYTHITSDYLKSQYLKNMPRK